MTAEPDPHWPEALVALIDALQTFIDIDVKWGNKLLAEGSVTQQEYDEGMKQIAVMRWLLKNLLAIEPDRSLDGLRMQ
jgi:hypothetical protein